MSKFKAVVDKILEMLSDKKLLEKSRFKETDFTRERKMPFRKLVLYMLNIPKESASAALQKFYRLLGEEAPTQQAFSKARNKINHLPFLKTFEITASEVAAEKRFRGYILNAVDSSLIALPQTKQLIKYFGATGEGNKSPTARASIRLDILNDIIRDAHISPITIAERKHARVFLKNQGSDDKQINIYDRGYFAWNFIFEHMEKEVNFLFRIKSKFNVKIDELPLGDHILELSINKKPIVIRVIKFFLPSGELETLVTDVFDEDLNEEDFKELYFLRWKIETKYDIVKNKLCLENFTGLSPNCIRQDFFAHMTVANLVAIAKMEADEKIMESRKDKNNKYEYVANVNFIIGSIKDLLVIYTLFQNEPIGMRAMTELLKTVQKCVVPIRPNRSFPRKLPRKAKFHYNSKPIS